MLKTFSLEKYAKYKTCAKMCKIWNETCAICTGFIFCTFFETIFCNFEIKGYFHFFFFLGGGGGGGGGAVEVILEVFISGIDSFHIIYFYFHLSITQKLNLSQ